MEKTEKHLAHLSELIALTSPGQLGEIDFDLLRESLAQQRQALAGHAALAAELETLRQQHATLRQDYIARIAGMAKAIAVATHRTLADSHALIVNNSAVSPTSEDSLAVPFRALDSLGNPASADSVFVTVAGPSGAVVFVDSMPIGNARIVSSSAGGQTAYVFRCQVSQIDGPGDAGVYALIITAKSTPLGLSTPTVSGFQIIADELSDQIAQIDDTLWVRGGAIDTNRTERGLGNSAGGRSLTLVACDSSTGQVIPGVRIALHNLGQTALLGLGLTDLTGASAFGVDADSVVAVALAPGYRFDPCDTIVVTTSAIPDTIYAAAWYPEPPASAGLCRVWGVLYGIDGAPCAGASVTAALADGVARLESSVVAPNPVSTLTDSTGLFQFDLIPSALLQAADTRYDITITRSDGVILRQRLAVPTQDVWQLTW